MRRYIPLAYMLSGPAFAFFPDWVMIWTLSLLLQARLADDVFSLEGDRISKMDRVLVQSPLAGVVAQFGLCLALLNALPLLTQRPLIYAYYGAFLALQHPRFPAAVKYGCLAMLVDQMSSISWNAIVIHGLLVSLAAGAFELGHDPFPSRRIRHLYALLLLGCLSFVPWDKTLWTLIAVFFIALGFLRLRSRFESEAQGRWLLAGSAHVSVAVIAGALFHEGSFTWFF